MSDTEKDYVYLGKEIERTFMQSAVGRDILEKRVSQALASREWQMAALLKTAQRYEEAVHILEDTAKRLRIAPQSQYDSSYPVEQGLQIQAALDALAAQGGALPRRALVIASTYEGNTTISQVTKKTNKGWEDNFFNENGIEGDEKEYLLGDDPTRYNTNKFLLACKRYLGLDSENLVKLEWGELEKVVQQLFDKLTEDPAVSLESYCEVLIEFVRKDAQWEWIIA